MAKEVVFVTGRNPAQGTGGGSSYVRAHMRAAMRAGFEPHVCCIDEHRGVTDEDFGIVHRVVSPLLLKWAFRAPKIAKPERFFAHWLAAFALSPYTVVAHARWLASSIERFLSERAGPHLVHGFYTWGCVGLDVRDSLPRSRHSAAANSTRSHCML